MHSIYSSLESPWSTLYSSYLHFFRCLLRLRRYKRKSVEVGVSWRQWVTGKGTSPTNQCWCWKTRVIAAWCGIKISAVHRLVLSQYSTRIWQTDRRTELRQQYCALHYMPHGRNAIWSKSNTCFTMLRS